jgi:hypothetical protein
MALGSLAASALLPVMASKVAAASLDSVEPWLFRPPNGPMLYSRRVERPMGDGTAVIATRIFEIRFSRLDEHFFVQGDQLDCHVEAPEALQQLARLEEARVETGLFPLQLDAKGLIAAGPNLAPASNPQLQAAIALALDKIEHASHAPEDAEYLRQFVASVERAASDVVAALPQRLFSPNAMPELQESAVLLPDGNQGSVSVSFSGQVDAESGLLTKATRTVETRIGESARTSMESWTLTRLD